MEYNAFAGIGGVERKAAKKRMDFSRLEKLNPMKNRRGSFSNSKLMDLIRQLKFQKDNNLLEDEFEDEHDI